MKAFLLAVPWRAILARLPLPMLALAASYGVYSFSALFVPQWVAVIQAAAFELTYIGLAVVEGMNEKQRQRATLISIGAVVTSILYNTLAGLFHRNPTWLGDLGYFEWGLAVLHGLPLAWVAYLVADLLLHSAPAQMVSFARVDAPIEPMLVDAPVAGPEAIKPIVCPHCGASLDSPGKRGAAIRWGHCDYCKGVR
jgi:hypothetical protein